MRSSSLDALARGRPRGSRRTRRACAAGRIEAAAPPAAPVDQVPAPRAERRDVAEEAPATVPEAVHEHQVDLGFLAPFSSSPLAAGAGSTTTLWTTSSGSESLTRVSCACHWSPCDETERGAEGSASTRSGSSRCVRGRAELFRADDDTLREVRAGRGGVPTVSLSRWSNSARSFCRHLARVKGAREPHTRSMGPIARASAVPRAIFLGGN